MAVFQLSRLRRIPGVTYELFDPQLDAAYEHGKVSLTYTADPNEKVVKPPIEQLESLFQKLEKLPSGAKFRVVVHTAPGASDVPGWQPTQLRELKGGVAQAIEVGDEEYGFGRIKGKVVYTIGNWSGQQHHQHNGCNK